MTTNVPSEKNGMQSQDLASHTVKGEMGEITVAQANLQKKKLATEELLVEAEKRKISFALVQEPYVGAKEELKQYQGTRVVQKYQNRIKPVKAAIVVFDGNMEVVEEPALTTENIAVAILKTKVCTLAVVSIYLEDHLPIEPYIEQMENVHKEIKKKTDKIIIGGDGNAWSTWWGSVVEDRRGVELLGALHEMNMHILNEGTEPTFDTIRGGKRYKSSVDITTCSEAVLGKVRNWRVDCGLTSSDHNALMFSLAIGKPGKITETGSTRKYYTKKADWTKFREIMQQNLTNKGITKETVRKTGTKEQLETMVGGFIESVGGACDHSIPRIKRRNKAHLPWMTAELEQLKKEMNSECRAKPSQIRSRRLLEKKRKI